MMVYSHRFETLAGSKVLCQVKACIYFLTVVDHMEDADLDVKIRGVFLRGIKGNVFATSLNVALYVAYACGSKRKATRQSVSARCRRKSSREWVAGYKVHWDGTSTLYL
jgi:hypothetical protein